jgi:large subunit ribosomal protein L13
MNTHTTHTIDASGKSLGRVASSVAKLLMGKDSAAFERNTVASTKVTVTNASKLSVSTKKMNTKTYNSYSGYPGGLKQEKMAKVVDKKGYSEVLRKAVYGMLPINKLRDKVIKNLTISE